MNGRFVESMLQVPNFGTYRERKETFCVSSIGGDGEKYDETTEKIRSNLATTIYTIL